MSNNNELAHNFVIVDYMKFTPFYACPGSGLIGINGEVTNVGVETVLIHQTTKEAAETIVDSSND